MKLFHNEFLDNQPEHVQEWTKNQPLWYDRDMVYVFLIGLLFGVLIGL